MCNGVGFFLITAKLCHVPYVRGLEGNLKINKFRIEGSVQSSDAEHILESFLSNIAVTTILEVCWTKLATSNFNFSQSNRENYQTSEYALRELKTSVRSMDFFDRLSEHGITQSFNV